MCCKKKKPDKTDDEDQFYPAHIKNNTKPFKNMTPEEKKLRVRYLWSKVRKHFTTRRFLARAAIFADRSSTK